MLTTLRFNLANTAIRHETLHGKQYIVAPMVMLTEGVHNGSGGALLYKADDIKKATPSWNMKPIVVYHPQINGQGVSACDPDVLEAQQVGMVMKATWNGKLRAEAWIDIDRATNVDARVIEALEQNKLMEVSTGLFTENNSESGDWNGEQYIAIAVNHQPDHLALLPDQIGACSIADGAGLLQLNEAAQAAGVQDVDRMLAREMDVLRRMIGNAMSHNSIHSALNRALRDRFKTKENEYLWIADVYDDKVVYELETNGRSTLYAMKYELKDSAIELSGEMPVEVVRTTEYRTSTGTYVGNEARITTKEDSTMDKKQLVAGLIANAALMFNESDRDALMGMDEAILVKMNPIINEEAPVIETPAPAPAPVENVNVAPKDPMTTEQFIAAAPPEIRQVLQNSLSTYEAEKAKLIGEITANKANAFTPEFLATKDVAELKGIAALACNSMAQPEPIGAVPMFLGQSFGPPMNQAPVNNNEDNDALVLPTMNFAQA